MDHKPAVSARTGRTDFERKSSLTKSIEKPENKSPLSERIKKHIEEIEQPKNQANMPQPANMLINKRVLPSRVKSRYFGLSWGCHRRFSVFRTMTPLSLKTILLRAVIFAHEFQPHFSDQKDESGSEKMSKMRISPKVSPKSSIVSRASSDDSGTLTPSSSENVSRC